MKLSQIPNSQNTQTAWLLAIVLFFSGLSFSSPTSHVREGQVKARTELVVGTCSRATSVKHLSSSQTVERHFTTVSDYVVKACGIYSALQFKAFNKIHRQIFVKLMNLSFLSQHAASNLPDLIA